MYCYCQSNVHGLKVDKSMAFYKGKACSNRRLFPVPLAGFLCNQADMHTSICKYHTRYCTFQTSNVCTPGRDHGFKSGGIANSKVDGFTSTLWRSD